MPNAEVTEPPFVECAAETGLDFHHFSGGTGKNWFIELLGPGVALIDFDQDGDLDIFIAQGTYIGGDGASAKFRYPLRGPSPPRGRLFRSDLTIDSDGRRHLRFIDITEQSGIDARGYGVGVAVGDYDNDGFPDLYISNWGPNQLWRNKGDGTFVDVTAKAGVGDPAWGTSCAFFDYDQDGWLDLYVCNYVVYRLDNHVDCPFRDDILSYCSPLVYAPAVHRLYRNRGDGAFEDVSTASGIASEAGNGLGVVTGDLNADGLVDIYVANDQMENFCWIQQADGKFVNEAMQRGCALNEYGQAEAGMGVIAADFFARGIPDLFLTHLRNETNTLYVNDGKGNFEDQTTRRGLGAPSRPFTGFGTAAIDFDSDSWEDIIVVNGAVASIDEQVLLGEPLPLKQRKLLFRNNGSGRFDDVSAAAGQAFAIPEVSRGLAMGDLDNDGAPDAVITQMEGPVRLLRNRGTGANQWLGLRLVGGEVPRDMLGAKVRVKRKNGPDLVRWARTDGSYVAAQDPRVLFGLGADTDGVAVEVDWPGAKRERWTDVPVRSYTTLRQGTGDPVTP